jgi:hypothetical protein
MGANTGTNSQDGSPYRFVWVDDDLIVLGGQWMAPGEDGDLVPLALAEVVAAHRLARRGDDPLETHVRATLDLVRAVGEFEDSLFPEPTDRLKTTLSAVGRHAPEVDPSTPEGERLRRGAEALEKLAADLAELVEEQLDGGSLAKLPPNSTRALCQATQTAWRLRRLVDPPSPLCV